MATLDENLLRFIRANNVLGAPSRTESPVVNAPTAQGQEGGNIQDLINQLYTPDSRFSDEYRTHLSRMPTRENPRFLNKLVASLYGAAGDFEGVNRSLYPGYTRDMEEWETRRRALEPAMTYERYQNTNERSSAYQTASNVLRERSIANQEELGRRAADARDYANQIRALVAQGGQIVEDEKTGQTFLVYRDGRKVPLDINKIPPLELEALKQSNRVASEDQRQDNRVEIENMRAATRSEIAALSLANQAELATLRAQLAGQNKWSNPVQAFDKDNKPLPFLISTNGVTGEVKKIPLDDAVIRTTSPGSGGDSEATQSETQKAAGISNKALQLANSNPQWAKYIRFSGTGASRRFIGITRPGMFFGPDQATYNSIFQAIYGREPYTAAPGITGGNQNVQPRSNTPTTNTNRPNRPTVGRVRVKGPNNQVGTVSAEDAKRLPEGWSIVE